MKYPVGTRLEFIYPEEFRSEVCNWKPCIVIGESLSGNPVVERLDSDDIFQVKNCDLLRLETITTIWWSRIRVDENGVPSTIAFQIDPELINTYKLSPGYSWHGKAFQTVVKLITLRELIS